MGLDQFPPSPRDPSTAWLACCPHGDTSCPCVDGDSCHYEGPDPMPCPNPPVEEQTFTSARIVKLNPDGSLPENIDLAPEQPIKHITLRSSFPTRPHCHVEGCRWRGPIVFIRGGCDPSDPLCGLLRIAPGISAEAARELGCGAIRAEIARGQAWLREQSGG